MSFATITASGIISEPKKRQIPTKLGAQEVMNFNLYVKPKNKNGGLGEENMVFSVSIWNNQIDTYGKLLEKGREITVQGNFEVCRFTTKSGELVEQNRIDFANVIGIGNTTEDRQVLKEKRKEEKNREEIKPITTVGKIAKPAPKGADDSSN